LAKKQVQKVENVDKWLYIQFMMEFRG